MGKIKYKMKSLLLLVLFPYLAIALESTIPVALLDQVEKGDSESAYFIGKFFLDGNRETEPQPDKAKEWFLKAAEMGNVHGMFELAMLLFDDEKYSDAKPWLEKATESGHAEAFYRLAYYPMYGYGDSEKDCKAAYKLLKDAQLRNVKSAFNDHAWMLATMPDRACRSGEKAWKIYSDMESLYNSNETIPWAYWDTKAAVLAEISEFNEAIKIQKWVVADNCIKEVDSDDLTGESLQELLETQKDTISEYCGTFIDRLKTYMNRKPWRETETNNILN
ncbi:MAG: hypothetical protein L3J52_05640 [Proteobacteria bacterium]|nr:hypothetical protein [Pseudomonadota bacterium]